MANWPPSLKPIKKYMVRAQEVENDYPIVSYYCRFYSLQRAIELRDINDPQATQFVTGLLEKCEAMKHKINTDVEMHKAHVEDFAMNVFNKADEEDRADQATRNTALTFYAAMCFMEVSNVFGELTEEMQEKLRYAKWKAADITKALREGRRPVPGAPGEAEATAAAAAAAAAAQEKQDQQQLPPPSNGIDTIGGYGDVAPSEPSHLHEQSNVGNGGDSKRGGDQYHYPTVAPAYPSSEQPSPLQERTVLSSANNANNSNSMYPDASENNTESRAPPRMPTLPMLQIPGQTVKEEPLGPPSISAVIPTPEANGGYNAPQSEYRQRSPPTDKPLQMPPSGYDHPAQPPTDKPLDQYSSYGHHSAAPAPFPLANNMSKPAGYPSVYPPPAHPPPSMVVGPPLPVQQERPSANPYQYNYEPSVKQTQEAQRLAKYAASALDFQDLKTAISNLEDALKLLRGGPQ